MFFFFTAPNITQYISGYEILEHGREVGQRIIAIYLLIKGLFNFILCVYMSAYMCVCVPCMCLVATEARGGHEMP